jgi:hypothetical protein
VDVGKRGINKASNSLEVLAIDRQDKAKKLLDETKKVEDDNK